MAVSLLGVAAFAAGMLLIRSHRPDHRHVRTDLVPPGESVPGRIALDRLRELGI